MKLDREELLGGIDDDIRQMVEKAIDSEKMQRAVSVSNSELATRMVSAMALVVAAVEEMERRGL